MDSLRCPFCNAPARVDDAIRNFALEAMVDEVAAAEAAAEAAAVVAVEQQQAAQAAKAAAAATKAKAKPVHLKKFRDSEITQQGDRFTKALSGQLGTSFK
jgi:hypothetical protein